MVLTHRLLEGILLGSSIIGLLLLLMRNFNLDYHNMDIYQIIWSLNLGNLISVRDQQPSNLKASSSAVTS